MKNILFFDIDGTLRDEACGVPKTAETAVRLCRERGHLVCLCTGRTLKTIPGDIWRLETDGVIAGGGSYIRFRDRVLRDSWFPDKEIRAAFHYLKEEEGKTAFALEGRDEIYMNHRAQLLLHESSERKWSGLDPQQKKQAAKAHKITYRENLQLFPSETFESLRISKICLWSSLEVFQKLTRLLSPENIQLAQQCPAKEGSYYEIIQAGCNKGQAVRFLCGCLGIPSEYVIAFGDGKNDIDMFLAAGTAVAVAGGDREAQEYADSVCEKPLQDGIYRELKRRALI